MRRVDERLRKARGGAALGPLVYRRGSLARAVGPHSNSGEFSNASEYDEVSMSQPAKKGTQKAAKSTAAAGKTKSASQQIDAIIKESGDWRGKKLSQLRALITKADPAVVEEVKWKKPSKPSGTPVWSHDGIICVADTLKNAVRLTFPKGAQMNDPKKLFNTRLESNTVRAIDFREGDTIDEAALTALILDVVKLNSRRAKHQRGPL
jgi:hypothetical protein